MNQKCKVCGEPAAGFHFGAFTCEGCKSFFGRTYSNVSAIGECKNGGHCVINKKNRTSCKACRLRKCLLVGMSKSGSRYGRRSNWFKIHCLLQEQTGMDQPLVPGMFGGNGSNGGGVGHSKNPDVKDEDEDDDEEEEEGRTPSTSSRSQSPGGGMLMMAMDDDLDSHLQNSSSASKENLRLMLANSRSSPVQSPCTFKHRPTPAFKRTSPQPGLLAIAGASPYSTPIRPIRTSSPKRPSEASSSHRLHNPHHHLPITTAAQLYQLYQQQQQQLLGRRHSSSSVSPTGSGSGGDLMPAEQESPIDLSCKSSSSSPVSSLLGHHGASSMCHIRAEILTHPHGDDDDDLCEASGTPLDLTTKG